MIGMLLIRGTAISEIPVPGIYITGRSILEGILLMLAENGIDRKRGFIG
jgi:hypothetical protein